MTGEMTTTKASEVVTLDHWIDGTSTPPVLGRYVERTSPVDRHLVSRVARGSLADVDEAATAALRAYGGWRLTKPIARGRLLLETAARIRAHADELVGLECAETGKPPASAAVEIESAAAYFEYYGTLVNLPAGDVLDLGSGYHVYTMREPFGVVGVITPWNIPLAQAARACAPALAAGNVVVAKPSEFTSSSTVRLAQLAGEAGLPGGVFNVVLGLGAEAGAALVEHPSVRKVAFTGSVAAGRTIGRVAAERVIPLTLELGGKSANIVFEDADLDLVAERSVQAYTANCGQVCSAAARILVRRGIHDDLVAKLVARSEALDLRGEVGPLITDAQRSRVAEYFVVAANEGAHPATGGTFPSDEGLGGGNFVRPTVYTGVRNDMRVAREEIFGPVLVVIAFDEEDDAVRITNDSEYGLVAAVWTQDVGRAFRVAAQLDVGQVFINTWTTGAVETPFGGYKSSGYGREKGIEALHQYQQLKTVTVAI